jgi:hypothetical protein
LSVCHLLTPAKYTRVPAVEARPIAWGSRTSGRLDAKATPTSVVQLKNATKYLPQLIW